MNLDLLYLAIIFAILGGLSVLIGLHVTDGMRLVYALTALLSWIAVFVIAVTATVQVIA